MQRDLDVSVKSPYLKLYNEFLEDKIWMLVILEY